MKNYLFIILFASVFFFSCTKEEPSDNVKQKAEELGLVFDKALNCYVPQNFYDTDRIIVKELPNYDSIENIKKHLKTGSLDSPLVGGIIEVVSQHSNQYSGTEEVSLALAPGWIITGVGALIRTSSNNYTSLVLERRYVYSDGSISDRVLEWDIEAPEQKETTAMEAWVSTPYNYTFATSFRIAGKYDVYKMQVGFRALNLSTMKLSLNETYVTGGINQGVNYWDSSYTPELYGEDVLRSVMLGIGLLSNNAGTKKLTVNTGLIKTQLTP